MSKTINKKILLLFFFIGFIFSQTTGKISGLVYDNDENPIIGASIGIIESGIGTATDYDGYYYIINLSPGSYTLKIDMIGFKSVTVESVVVSVNKTTRIDIQMEESFVQGEEVVVTASKISTKKDQSGTIKNISGEQIDILPIKDVQSIVSMQAGIVDGHFRGGRSTEVTYLVDGMRTDDAFGGESQTVYLEPTVLKDLEVITGTFNAEYGRAMSGVVNQVTKDGNNKFETSFSTRYENYFTPNNDIFIGVDKLNINLNQDYNYQISGPILKNRIFFFLNFRYQDNLGHLNGYDFFNVSDDSDFAPDVKSQRYSEHSGSHVIETYCSNSRGGEIFYPGTDNQIVDNSECIQYGDCEEFLVLKDTLGQIIGFESFEFSYSMSGFNHITESQCIEKEAGNTDVITRFIPAQIRNRSDSFVPMNNFKSSSVLGKVTFKPSTKFKISLMNTLNNYEGSWYNHSYKYSPDSRSSNFSTNNFTSIFMNYLVDSSTFIDWKLSYNTKEDGQYVFENPLDSRYAANELYVSESGFLQGGHDKIHNNSAFNDYNFKFDLNTQINSIHNFKIGLDHFIHNISIRNYTIKDQNPDNPESYIPSIDIGDLESSFSEEYDVTSYEFSGYIQDKMEFSDMVINFGLRYDTFNPNTSYPSNYRDPRNEYYNALCGENILEQNDVCENLEYSVPLSTNIKSQTSPRFALSYQISDALLRFSYGHFFQMPPLYSMYSNPTWLISADDFTTILGNPNLEAEKTVNYEFGYWSEINDLMSYEIVVFNKDIYNLLTTITLQNESEVKYGLYSNKDYGNARGLELIFDYIDGPLSLVANYTYQHTKGIADSPTTSFDRQGANQDPITRLLPLSWDQRHTFNFTLGYNIEKYGFTASAYYNSGTAFSFEPISTNPLAAIDLEPNNAYKPTNYLVNLSSYFNLPAINARITFEIYNLFDTLNEYGVNSQTGRAYSAILNESAASSFKNNYTTIEDTYQDPSSYGAPRSIKIGIDFRY